MNSNGQVLNQVSSRPSSPSSLTPQPPPPTLSQMPRSPAQNSFKSPHQLVQTRDCVLHVAEVLRKTDPRTVSVQFLEQKRAWMFYCLVVAIIVIADYSLIGWAVTLQGGLNASMI